MDFSNLRYDLSLIPPGKTVIQHFPALAEFKEFKENKNDLVARIAILATDEGSPFVRSERDDYEKRIQKIFEHLKIEDEHLFDCIKTGVDIEYNKLVNRYFIQCDNLAYVMWSNMLQNFHYIGLALREPPDMSNLIADMSKRSALQKQQTAIHEDLIRYEREVFPDTTTRKIVRNEVAKILQIPEKHAEAKGVI